MQPKRCAGDKHVLSMAGCIAILRGNNNRTLNIYTGMEIKMQNVEQVRFNMIEQQIRPCDVLEGRILDLLHHVRRENFVPDSKQAMAFMDMEIPLGYGVSMWQPKLEARALQELHLGHNDRVLEVGTGSGYLTALLSSLAGQVTSVEIVPELSEMARQHLQPYHRENITLAVGDASHGWGEGASFDAIVLTGSTPILPEIFKTSLNIGGRLFAIVGEAPVMEAKLITRVSADTYTTVNIMETSIAPLQNAEQPKRFVF